MTTFGSGLPAVVSTSMTLSRGGHENDLCGRHGIGHGGRVGAVTEDRDLHMCSLRPGGSHGCIPFWAQRWKTWILAAGQALSQGMEPSCSRVRMSVARARTSS